MKRLLLPAVLLLSPVAWADIPPPDDESPPVEAPPAPAPSRGEKPAPTACATTSAVSLAMAALVAGWVMRQKHRGA